jgi:hypothetical protein
MGEAFSVLRLLCRPHLSALGIFERSSVLRRSGWFVPVEKDYGESLGRGLCTAEPTVLVSLPAVLEFRAV